MSAAATAIAATAIAATVLPVLLVALVTCVFVAPPLQYAAEEEVVLQSFAHLRYIITHKLKDRKIFSCSRK